MEKLAKVIGSVAPLLGSVLPIPGGEKIGQMVAQVFGGNAAQPDALAELVQKDPEAAVKLKRLETESQVELRRLATDASRYQLLAQTQQLESVNRTMRIEAQSDNWWTSGWRPYWGFISGTAFAMQVGAICHVMIYNPEVFLARAGMNHHPMSNEATTSPYQSE